MCIRDSYQCAWLYTYYPAEWMAAFLDKEPESRKEKAINIAKKNGFKLEPLDINKSGVVWEIEKQNTLVQPLTSIKGLGEKAIEQIMLHRPFNTVEELLFHEEVTYAKLNKKALDALTRARALECLQDERFVNLKHFWSAVVDNRPKNRKKLREAIEATQDTTDFTKDEYIENAVQLSGLYPFELVLDDKIRKRLNFLCVPPISQFDRDLSIAWFIPREVIKKKTVNGRPYYIVKTIDGSSSMVDIKCWGVRPDKDKIYLNRPYMAKLTHQEQWGFSTRQGLNNWKLLG